jgi:NAD(P)-dependent dehydrogenase (short-subunit alcohol dehydrogenase family)
MNPRRTFTDARCLITGATSPFGQAMARRLARSGARIILNSRSLPELKSILHDWNQKGIPTGSLVAIDADLTESEGRNKLIHAIDRQFGALDIVINAASVRAIDRGTDRLRQVLEINLYSLMDLTSALEPLLEAGQAPAMINIGATHRASNEPNLPEDQASQSAATTYTEAMRAEWSKRGIHLLRVDLNPRQTFDEQAQRTLQALRRGDLEVKGTVQGQLRRQIDRVLSRWKTQNEPIPTTTEPPAIRRLPRPHFGLRMQRSRNKGD